MKHTTIKTVASVFAVALLIVSAEASVSLQMNYYNSDDSMSVSMDGYNLEFESFCELYADSMLYNNGGSSKNSDAKYSYSASLNDKSAFSSAETDSGKFAWSTNIVADSSSNEFKVATKSEVKDGHLRLNYGNEEIRVKETMNAENAVYSQQAGFIDDSINSQGGGSTIQPVPGLAEKLAKLNNNANNNDQSGTEDDASSGSKGDDSSPKVSSTSEQVSSLASTPSGTDNGDLADNSQDGNPEDDGESSETPSEEKQPQGITHNMEITYDDRKGSVETDVMGITEAQWVTGAGYDRGKYYFGTKVRGVSTEPMDDLEMTGKAANFPTQTLPPGEVKIVYNNEFDPWELVDDKDYAAMVDDEFRDFESEYSGVSTPALWYSLSNLYYKKGPVTYTRISDPSLGFEIYNFGMGFTIKDI